MIPNFSSYYSANECLRYVKSLCQSALRIITFFINLSNRSYVYLHKLCSRVFNALKPFIPCCGFSSSFLIHISNIISLRAEKEMAWPNAYSSIALVEDAHSFWDFAIMKFVAKSVRRNLISHSTWPKITPGILTGMLSACPKPAFLSFINFTPKTLFCGHRRGLLTHNFRSVKIISDLRDDSLVRKAG